MHLVQLLLRSISFTVFDRTTNRLKFILKQHGISELSCTFSLPMRVPTLYGSSRVVQSALEVGVAS